MPRIVMDKTARGASDGNFVQTYEEGQEYDVSESLADNFIRQQSIARLVKAKGAAPENKDAGAPPENKGPRHVGGGTWELPDGRRIKGKAKAFAAWEAPDEAAEGV